MSEYYSPPQLHAPNVLVNGGFWFAQRQDPAAYTTISNDGYGPDRWRCCRENADLQFIRTSNVENSGGLHSRYYGSFKKITNAGKILVCQPLLQADTVPLLGRTVTWQIALKADSARTVKLCLLYLSNSGTANTLPANIVSTWEADGTNPTFGTNIGQLSASAAYNGTISLGVVSCSVTSAWKTFGGVFTPDAGPTTYALNLIPAIWTDADLTAATGIIDAAEADLHLGGFIRPWHPLEAEVELVRCQSFYEKSYSRDTAPGTVTDVGAVDCLGFNFGNEQRTMFFRTSKRTTPSMTLWSNATGTAGKWRNINAGTDLDAATELVGENSFGTYLTGGAAGSNIYRFHWAAAAEL